MCWHRVGLKVPEVQLVEEVVGGDELVTRLEVEGVMR